MGRSAISASSGCDLVGRRGAFAEQHDARLHLSGTHRFYRDLELKHTQISSWQEDGLLALCECAAMNPDEGEEDDEDEAPEGEFFDRWVALRHDKVSACAPICLASVVRVGQRQSVGSLPNFV
eukprot:6192242-Pleurochrysis_carterae.AAC.3